MKDLIKKLTSEYEMYLKDESKKQGYSDSISFPRNIQEAAEVVKRCFDNEKKVTIQGSRTGVGGGAVPFGGHIMSLEKMKKLSIDTYENKAYVTAEAGVTLNELNRFIRQKTDDIFFFPPDPTEGTASVGGMISCNSSGARTYGYGAVRNYVNAITVILADGSLLNIKRGMVYACGRKFEIEAGLPAENNIKENEFKENDCQNTNCGSIITKKISGVLPSYIMPKIKNAAGYYVEDNMDMIDLFIGAEGTLGIIISAEIKLIKKPKYIWGVIAFFEMDWQGINFAQDLKTLNKSSNDLISIEFFDYGSLELLRDKKKKNPLSADYNVIDDKYREAVFIEIKGETKEDIVDTLRTIEVLIKKNGGNANEAWIAASTRSFDAFKNLRHHTPECVNEAIAMIKKQCGEITKLGSDMAVKDEDFMHVVAMYRKDLEENGLYYVMFGHIGNNHLHVNIISRNIEEYNLGKSIFLKWAEKIADINGSVSAEHGVGKLKRDFLVKMYGEVHIDEMRQVKKSFDSKGIFGIDNIFVWQ